MSVPTTPEQAALRLFVFRKEGTELVCRHFWDPNPSEEKVGITRFKIDEETAEKVVVVRCLMRNRPQRFEGSEAGPVAGRAVEQEVKGDVQPLPDSFKGMQGKVKHDLTYVLAQPVYHADGTIWGVVDLDTSNELGKARLQSSVADTVMLQLARNLATIFSS
jgi:hypothetical protein